MQINKLLISAVTLSALGLNSHAIAQEKLEPIIVTADKIPTKSQSVGSSVTVITGEEMKNKNIVFVTDYLKQIPGVSLYQNGGRGGVSRVSLRGTEDNQTLVLINGIEVNDGAAGSAFDFSHLLAADIDKIEVIRGSQSALYGSDAIGGVINIITNTAPKDGVSGKYRIEYGDNSSVFSSVGSSFANDVTDINFNFQGETTSGESFSPNGPEADGYENVTLDLNTKTNLSDNIVFTLFGRYVDATNDFDSQDFSDPSSPTFGQLIDADNETDVNQFYGKAELDWMSDNERFQQILGYNYTDTENENDSEGTLSEFNSDKNKFYYQLNNFNQWGSGLLKGDYNFTFLYEYEDEDYEQVGFSNQTQSFDQNGFVWQAQADLEQGLTVTGSVRFDDNSDFNDEVTYRTSASYAINKFARLHGSYGTGVKNPGFTELFGFFPDSFVGNPGLSPEKSESFDIGIENKFLDDRITTDITYFNISLEDEIVSTFDSETFLSSVDNLDRDSDRQGVELSVLVNVTDNWFARSAYTYLDADGPDGRSELRRPSHTFSVSSDYKFEKGQVGAELVYTSSSLDNDFTTSPSTVTRLDDFTILNISAQYPIYENLNVTGRIDNVTDENYQTVNGFETNGIGAFIGLQGNF